MKHTKLIFVILLLGLAVVAFAQNNALYFDGIDDCVQIGSMTSAITTTFTVEAWFSPATLSNFSGQDAAFGRTLFGSSSKNTEKPIWVSHVGQNIWVRTFGGNDPIITYNAGLVVDQWYHIAVSASRSGTTRLYINGVEVASASSGTQYLWNNTFTIGDLRPGRGLAFNGIIDEVRVWSDIRTGTEISSNFEKEIDPSSEGLVGYWKLNETSGTVASDSSSPQYNGQIQNGLKIHPNPIWVDGNPTLPVELSIFTATFTITNFVTLHWVTQSETGVSGYYLYRSLNDNLVNAELVSPLIPATNTATQQSYSFQDTELYESGNYYYWLQSVDYDGSFQFFGPVMVRVEFGPGGTPEIPLSTRLRSVYPNPFNTSTAVVYGIDKSADVKINIYNSKGQLVRSYNEGTKAPANYTLLWDGLDKNGQACPSGIYLIRMQAGSEISEIKALLQK